MVIGGILVRIGEFIGKLGIACACLKSLEAWVSKIYEHSIWPCWENRLGRFLIKPNSLVAKIYKARYFPKSSFIDATLGNCPSFCWRSIMASHDMVCNGVRRRIGDGKSTLIWGHPWLPDDPTPMIHCPMPPTLNGSLVSGLINEDTGSWDHSILWDIFLPSDVNRITKIPISPVYEDSWFWHGDPRGCYTVKGGYRYLLGEVEVNPSCPKCGLANEDVMHALVLCDYSHLVWHEASLPLSSIPGDNFCLWFSNALTILTEENVGLAVAVLYNICRARNTAASSALHAWKEVHCHATPAAHTLPNTQQAPIDAVALPSTNRRRCFFDAGHHAGSMRSTFGAVLLSHDGEFIMACASLLPDCFTTLIAEAAACREVLAWLRRKDVGDVHLFTDCLQLRQGLAAKDSSNRSYAGLIIDACKEAMSTFSYCRVDWVARSANTIAHSLATLAFSSTDFDVLGLCPARLYF
ncbi:uncharacterized protein LOC116010716 [Ipomoea triloba]|uniref:uncharacterized protein LOC116010716 n=1 Tax=Ipomoea triloba TaxID=35885 RepID=UPI00125D56AC|nr:uncharacterized protein LOC116010716 [Ipomoea triloba]